MACWSAENATNAYLRTMRMGKNAKEPNGAEFISALAAGNNARFTVVACGGASDSTTLALATAAQQTGGRANANNVEFVIGDAKDLLLNIYKDSDFVAIDCNLENHEAIISALQEKAKHNQNNNNNTIVLGYNAFCKESWRNSALKTQLCRLGKVCC
ncbi:hypothetical protein DH2020_034065 [Rehmannia glutinosa]|uniref:Uncharacterized protein n=1 Tax=Rehmannia glutinosa TaxID=99300 RepID=A0ABR0VAD4_REHGL